MVTWRQRLQIEDWYRRHPEIDDEPIDAPLIGLGLPRTGSTALSFLLAEDPDVRSLRLWESAQPCPPPSTVDGPDPRDRAADESSEVSRRARKRPRAVRHPTGRWSARTSWRSTSRRTCFHAFAQLPSYSDWLLDADLTSTYRYERRVLKLLQWGEPTRPWRLKTPAHMLFLDDLDRVVPRRAVRDDAPRSRPT